MDPKNSETEATAKDGAAPYGKSASGAGLSDTSEPKVARADTTISGRLGEMIQVEAKRLAGQIERMEVKGASNIEGNLAAAFAAIANHARSEEVTEREAQDKTKAADFKTSLEKAIEIGRSQGMSGEQIKAEMGSYAQNL